MVERVITPTPGQRTIALLKALSPAAVVVALHFGGRAYTSNVAPLPLCDQLTGMRLAVLFVALVLLGFMLALLRTGLRAWRSGQFPAPGTSVLFRTRVSVGWWARASAISMLILASLFAVALGYLLNYFVFSEVGPYLLGFSRCEP